MTVTFSRLFGAGLGAVMIVSMSPVAWSQEASDCPAPGTNNLGGQEIEVREEFGGEDIGFVRGQNPAPGTNELGGQEVDVGEDIDFPRGRNPAPGTNNLGGQEIEVREEFGGEDIGFVRGRNPQSANGQPGASEFKAGNELSVSGGSDECALPAVQSSGDRPATPNRRRP